MSDFFGNLLARSLPAVDLSTPSLLRPRLPSWFEPAGGDAEVAAPPADSGATGGLAAPTVLSERDEPPAAPRPGPAAASGEPPHPMFKAAEPPAAPAPPAAEARLPRPPASVAEGRFKMGDQVGARDKEPQKMVAASKVDKSVAPPAELRPQEDSLPIQNRLRGRQSALAGPALLRPAPDTSSSPATLRPAAPPPEPRVERQSVQIHIGRIDVRAVQQAEAPRAQPSSRGPQMTLDDYLRQRQGGKR